MADKPVKILLPKDRFQIGSTPDGNPVWVDPKELLPSEDEKLELKQNLLNSKERNAINKLTEQVMMNAGRFVQATFYAVAPKDVLRAHERGEMALVADWVQVNEYQVIQDGLKTIIKVKGKVIREMKATVSQNCADMVESRVRQIMAVKN